MLRYASIALLIVGLCLLGYGGFKLYHSHAQQTKRLDDASGFVSDTVVRDKKDVTGINYEMYDVGETIGTLYIPKLDREIPIIEGTDEEELSEGVGHYNTTGLPGQDGQMLLSGHRDTVFRDFGELENGDEFHIKLEEGTFIYVIDDSETQIVPSDDTSIIDSSIQNDVLTVSTCYPFSYVGNAPDRYVLQAYPK